MAGGQRGGRSSTVSGRGGDGARRGSRLPVWRGDMATVGQIREQLENATATGATHVVLDLRGVTFLDSTGLHLALDADAASRAQGWKFGLIGGPADVQRVFELTGARVRLPFLTTSQLAVLLTAPGDTRRLSC